ncbi:hypothetical protein C414_000440035 [Campylobacter jejuni subsp. jejuni 414]|nr:hypothetical protein C414_000440035 [Campylobacter jejuni subsp. jejuni 414]
MPDFKESLKIKEHLSCKLVSALIKLIKQNGGGGFVRFFFRDVLSLKKEFKAKKLQAKNKK